MPGLAKVGKTTRASANRVLELSSATGVPSPFILAFQQPVDDCDAAELWVHRELERAGYRVADRKEFFNAPLHEIVELVTKAGKIRAITGNVALQDICTTHEDTSSALAEELSQLGYAHLHGSDSLLPSRRKALNYFEQAAALSHSGACVMAGLLHRWGDDGKGKDLEKALAFLNKGVQLGDWQSFAAIASIFLETGNISATRKYWCRFFSAAQESIAGSAEEAMYAERALSSDGVTYCETVAADELQHCIDSRIFNCVANLLLSGVEKEQLKLFGHADKWWVDFKQPRLLAAQHFIEQQLTT